MQAGRTTGAIATFALFAFFAACGSRTGLTHLDFDVLDAALPDTFVRAPDVGPSIADPRSKTSGIALGDSHTCARRADGSAACWGKNLNGQLGIGTMSEFEPAPTPVVGLDGIVELAAGTFDTCARTAAGAVYCWGDNSSGQLGNGAGGPSAAPVAVSGLADAIELAAGAFHTCARRKTGAVLCWGRNDYGQIGDGTELDAHTPTPVLGIDDATAIGAGDNHTCAVRGDTTVSCWGRNGDGQLGDTSLVEQDAPVSVKGLAGALAIAAGETHTCALTEAGVLCWGLNLHGQLGYGFYDGGLVGSLTPVAAKGVSRAVQIAAGDSQTCALAGAGTITCWGQNNNGQLGEGPQMFGDATLPTPVVMLTDAVEIGLGSEHTCARTRDDALYCWGANGSGQLGAGTLDFTSVPAPVVGL